MNRIWNLQTKIVALVLLLLVGSFLLQGVAHNYGKQRLFKEVDMVAQDLTNEVINHFVAAIESKGKALTTPLPRRATGVEVVVRGPGNRNKKMLIVGWEPVQETIRRSFKQVVSEAKTRMELRAKDSEQMVSLPEHIDHVVDRALFEPVAATSTIPTMGDMSSAPYDISDEIEEQLDELSRIGGQARIPIDSYADRLVKVFEDSREFDMLATAGVLFLGLSLAWFFGVRMTRPMKDLAAGFERVAAGDLGHRVGVDRSGGEFRFLGEQFNRMARGLQENRQLERELVQRERVQHMGDLAAGVAHDVRNPLNAIHLNVGQIRDEFMPDDPEKRARFERFTSDVQREVERLNELVSNFLSLAQPSSTDTELVDPNALVAELGRLLRKEAVGRKVELRTDLEEALPSLLWNRQEIKSAFLNVAINSLQSMEPEGGTLDIITGIREVGDAEGEEGVGERAAVVTFVDTGVGISEEDLEKIFIPYFTTRKGGTGLGMPVARRIAERNGGRMQVQSRLGEGTAVSFLFPLSVEQNAVIDADEELSRYAPPSSNAEGRA